jgi:hypothetical protein
MSCVLPPKSPKELSEAEQIIVAAIESIANDEKSVKAALGCVLPLLAKLIQEPIDSVDKAHFGMCPEKLFNCTQDGPAAIPRVRMGKSIAAGN